MAKLIDHVNRCPACKLDPIRIVDALFSCWKAAAILHEIERVVAEPKPKELTDQITVIWRQIDRGYVSASMLSEIQRRVYGRPARIGLRRMQQTRDWQRSSVERRKRDWVGHGAIFRTAAQVSVRRPALSRSRVANLVRKELLERQDGKMVPTSRTISNLLAKQKKG